MTQKCKVCGQIKSCTRRDYSYPTRHFEINCDECHKKHCEEVKKVQDRAIWEAIFIADCNREVSTQFNDRICLCCGKEFVVPPYIVQDFCNGCYVIICKNVFDKANGNLTCDELKEKIRAELRRKQPSF